MQTINERIDRIEADLTATERQERRDARIQAALDRHTARYGDALSKDPADAADAVTAAHVATGYAVITRNPKYGWEVFTTHRHESDAQGMRDALTRSNPAREVDVIRGGQIMAIGECDRRNEVSQ